jgi:hypothetical protein
MVTNRSDINKAGFDVFSLGSTHAECKCTGCHNGGKRALHEVCIHYLVSLLIS